VHIGLLTHPSVLSLVSSAFTRKHQDFARRVSRLKEMRRKKLVNMEKLTSIVRINGVTSLVCRHFDSRSHDIAHVGAVELEPFLVWPAVER